MFYSKRIIFHRTHVSCDWFPHFSGAAKGPHFQESKVQSVASISPISADVAERASEIGVLASESPDTPTAE